MKALTVRQPWASLLAHGAKRFETRSWKINYRGKLAIHAGKFSTEYYNHGQETQRAMYEALKPHYFPNREVNWGYVERACTLGAIIAIGDLVDVWKSIESADAGTVEIYGNGGRGMGKYSVVREPELMFGDFTPGQYAFELDNVVLLPLPIYCNGRQGLWDCSVNLNNAYFDPGQTEEMKEILRPYIRNIDKEVG
jgi:hypothetical protein